MKSQAKHVVLTTAIICAAVGVSSQSQARCDGDVAKFAGTACFDSVPQLLDYLLGDNPLRRNHTVRLVQPRAGRSTPMAAHNQFNAACFFYAVAPVIEYLGYSRFEHQGRYSLPMFYRARGGIQTFPLEVGYQGSAEDLLGKYVNNETLVRTIEGDEGAEIYPCGFFDVELCQDPDDKLPPGSACDPEKDPRQTLRLREGDFPPAPPQSDTRTQVPCFTATDYPYFRPGQEYGLCQNLSVSNPQATDRFPAFLNEVLGGCGGPCSCDATARCGMYHFLNRALSIRENLAGASDARNIQPENWLSDSPPSPAEETTQNKAARKIIRAFVDNNVPLLISSNGGGHHMPVVGYAHLDRDGLPEMAIAADSTRLVYWTVHLDTAFWHSNARWFPNGMTPWNQHLGRGCEPGGWAERLDADPQIPTAYRLCTMPAGAPLHVVEPRYGIRLVCEREGRESIVLRTAVEDPFIADERTLACDRVTLRYADGVTEVSSAQIDLFGYDAARSAWIHQRSVRHDRVTQSSREPGRKGLVSTVVWDANWRGRHWLTSPGIPDNRTRATISLTLDDGHVARIEVAPPSTYGVELQCLNDSRVTARYRAAPGEAFVLREPIFWVPGAQMTSFPDSHDRRCDAVFLRLALGSDDPATMAEIQRYYYTHRSGWQSANPVWRPNTSGEERVSLSGRSLWFRWDRVWPDDYWLVAKDVGSDATRGDRKTVIRLMDSRGLLVRQVEVAPH